MVAEAGGPPVTLVAFCLINLVASSAWLGLRDLPSNNKPLTLLNLHGLIVVESIFCLLSIAIAKLV